MGRWAQSNRRGGSAPVAASLVPGPLVGDWTFTNVFDIATCEVLNPAPAPFDEAIVEFYAVVIPEGLVDTEPCGTPGTVAYDYGDYEGVLWLCRLRWHLVADDSYSDWSDTKTILF